MCLDAVPLLVIIRHVQHLDTEVGPLCPHSLRTEGAHIHGQLCHGEDPTLVDTLWTTRYKSKLKTRYFTIACDYPKHLINLNSFTLSR